MAYNNLKNPIGGNVNRRDFHFLKRNLWKEFQSSFVDNIVIFIIGLAISVFLLLSLFIQENYPYQDSAQSLIPKISLFDKSKDDKSENDESERVEFESDDSDTQETDKSQGKYKNYAVTYKNKEGVSKKQAKRLLKNYLCYEWESGVKITTDSIEGLGTGETYTYSVLHIRKKEKKTILVFLKLTSGSLKGSIIKFKVKKVDSYNYTMQWKIM